MMKKIKYLIIILPFLLTGCYNYRELNSLAIATAMGIDKIDDSYNVTFQIVNTQKTSSDDNSSSNPKISIYEQTGKTIQEAARALILKSPKRVYGNDIELLIISESVAKEGIKEILDLFFRDPESRKQFLVLVSKNTTSKEILETLTPLEAINAQNIIDSIMADSEYYGVSEDITFEKLMDMYLNDNEEITLPSISLIGSANNGEKKENLEESNPNTKPTLDTMAIFKNDKLLGYTNKDESIALSFIRNELENTVLTLECKDEKNKYFSVELIDVISSLNTKNNKLEIDLEIMGNGNIAEIYCDVNLEKNETIENIEKQVENHISTLIKDSIKSINNTFKSDIYGFKDLFHKNNLKLFKKIKKDYYDKYFNEIKINTKINIKLIEKGNILKVIENEK